MGMDVDVGAVPRREPGMEPFEVMTSESQERMLAIVTPADRAAVEEVCRRWEVRATVIGTVTAPVPGAGGPPAHPRRPRWGTSWPTCPPPRCPTTPPSTTGPWPRPADLERRRADDPAALAPPADCGADVLAMLADTSWVWRQYDHQLFLNTVAGPGGDAAVLRLAAPGLPREPAGPGPVHRLQPPLVRARSPGRHRRSPWPNRP